jgi:hypothetical protein
MTNDQLVRTWKEEFVTSFDIEAAYLGPVSGFFVWQEVLEQ